MEEDTKVDNLQEEIVSDAETTADSKSPIENETEESKEVSNTADSASQTGDDKDTADTNPKTTNRFKELVDRTKYKDDTISKLQKQVEDLRQNQSQQNYGYDQYGYPIQPQIDVKDLQYQLLTKQMEADKLEQRVDKIEIKNPLLNPDSPDYSKAAAEEFYSAVYDDGVTPERASALLSKSYEVAKSIAGSQSRQAIAQKQSVKPVKSSGSSSRPDFNSMSVEKMRAYLIEHPEED